MTFATVPWYPGLQDNPIGQMPGPAVRLVHLVNAISNELGPVDFQTLVGGVVLVGLVDRERAAKAVTLAAHLGLIGCIPLSTTKVAQA